MFKFPALVLDTAETNPIGDFMLTINNKFVKIGRDFVFLSVYDKRSNKKSPFNITNSVNWILTMQSQLVGPFVVHWGP
jgi:hypothetical protein